MVTLAVSMVVGVAPSPKAVDTLLLVYTTGLWVYLAFKFDIVTPHPTICGEEIVRTTVPAVNSAESKKTN